LNTSKWFHGCFWFSPHMGTGSVGGIQLLVVLHMLISIMVMVGYHTRLFSFLLLVSLLLVAHFLPPLLILSRLYKALTSGAAVILHFGSFLQCAPMYVKWLTMRLTSLQPPLLPPPYHHILPPLLDLLPLTPPSLSRTSRSNCNVGTLTDHAAWVVGTVTVLPEQGGFVARNIDSVERCVAVYEHGLVY
jgi:hypothetical protein